MPIFCFVCENCKKEFEQLVLYSKINEVVCPKCNSSNVKKVWQNNVNLQFKGKGFYKTDYSTNTQADKINK